MKKFKIKERKVLLASNETLYNELDTDSILQKIRRKYGLADDNLAPQTCSVDQNQSISSADDPNSALKIHHIDSKHISNSESALDSKMHSKSVDLISKSLFTLTEPINENLEVTDNAMNPLNHSFCKHRHSYDFVPPAKAVPIQNSPLIDIKTHSSILDKALNSDLSLSRNAPLSEPISYSSTPRQSTVNSPDQDINFGQFLSIDALGSLDAAPQHDSRPSVHPNEEDRTTNRNQHFEKLNTIMNNGPAISTGLENTGLSQQRRYSNESTRNSENISSAQGPPKLCKLQKYLISQEKENIGQIKGIHKETRSIDEQAKLVSEGVLKITYEEKSTVINPAAFSEIGEILLRRELDFLESKPDQDPDFSRVTIKSTGNSDDTKQNELELNNEYNNNITEKNGSFPAHQVFDAQIQTEAVVERIYSNFGCQVESLELAPRMCSHSQTERVSFSTKESQYLPSNADASFQTDPKHLDIGYAWTLSRDMEDDDEPKKWLKCRLRCKLDSLL